MKKDNVNQQGLYYPEFEHDACGIGTIVNIDGEKSHDILSDCLTILEKLKHRGGTGADENTGDGAGVLFNIPHKFFLEELKLGNIKEEQITMTSIRKFQNSTMETANSKKFKDYINKRAYGSKSKDALVSILSASDNTYKSITAVFGQKMNIFDDINVANVTCTSDFKFNVLGSEPVALYVIVPDEDKTYFTLVTIIVGLLYRDLVKLANSNDNKKLPYEIDFILDDLI